MKPILLALLCVALSCAAQTLNDIDLPRPAPSGARIAIGFLGFMDKWDNQDRSVRKLTLRLRQQGWQAESFSHWKIKTAKKAILQALDENRNQRIDPGEAAAARVVIFGQSMGGAATVALAKYLQAKRVPVLLTVQVDSVGARDSVIPENVHTAANFYQSQLLTVRGEDRIRAANPTNTKILGNFEYQYPWWTVALTPDSWARQLFGGGHARMEADPIVWSRIETLIQEAGINH